MLVLLFFSACLFLQASAVPKKEAMEYLRNYGYIESTVLQTNPQISQKEFETALINFQKFVGLKQTGKLDNETCAMMKKPRCGVKDKFEFEEDGQNSDRNRSTGIHGEAWNREELTYRVFRYARNLQYRDVDAVFEQALSTWASVTNLHFQQIYELADINIAFVGMNNSHSHLLRSGVYAHTFLPPTGTVYFSQDWNWTIREPSGMDLFLVAVHEFGHALGLQHSTSNKSIMYPYLQTKSFNPNFILQEEDVQNIQSLYGPRRSHPPAICPNSSFDAIFEYPAGVIYVLKGEYYWKLIPDGIASGYPRLISHRWPGLPSDIDAATATNMGLTYFFKRDRYWVYDHSCRYAYETSYISVGWPGIPDNMDGATWGGHSIFYFFKGDLYWKYDLSQSPKVSTSYPKPTTTNWGGVEGLFDDVLYVNSGYIYFFTNRTYYRYNCATTLIDYGHPSQPNFPRSTGPWWFHCDEEDVKENTTSSTSSTSIVVTGMTAVSTTVEESAQNTTSNLTTSITTTKGDITDVEENVTSPIPSTSIVVTGMTAVSTTVEESAQNTTSNLTTSITTTKGDITDVEENVTSPIPSTSIVVTGMTAVSTTVEESAQNTTSNLTTSITTTTKGDITDVEETVTSPIPSTSIVVTGMTAVSTTVEESAQNTTSNLTTSITTTKGDITDVEENVTSSIPSTSTEEMTIPASGRELDYVAENFTRSGKLLGIHTSMSSDVAACPLFSTSLAIVILLAMH